MQCNLFRTVRRRFLAAMSTTVIAILLLMPAAWAASKYRVVYTFTGPDGANPRAALIFDEQGLLYGTTSNGGTTNYGTVFSLDSTGKEAVLYSFAGPDGVNPFAPVVRDKAGNLYGTASAGGPNQLGAVFKLDVTNALTIISGSTFEPRAGLVFDKAGRLYGTTMLGGTGEKDCDPGCGTVFRLTPNPDLTWTQEVLYAPNPPYWGWLGVYPVGGVIVDANGYVYGTMSEGGNGNCQDGTPPGCGVVFELTPSSWGSGQEWTITQFHNFTAQEGYPFSDLTMDKHGNIYGTTIGYHKGRGIVFKATHAPSGLWKWSVLHTFKGPDGANPRAKVILDAAGALYGTTSGGGAFHKGTVFKLTPSNGGWKETVLYSFKGGADGADPEAGLVFDKAGNLYGTTVSGGAGFGVVFRIKP